MACSPGRRRRPTPRPRARRGTGRSASPARKGAGGQRSQASGQWRPVEHGQVESRRGAGDEWRGRCGNRTAQ
eukprot:4813540-Alexandrium_andersonii.AAC.1